MDVMGIDSKPFVDGGIRFDARKPPASLRQAVFWYIHGIPVLIQPFSHMIRFLVFDFHPAGARNACLACFDKALRSKPHKRCSAFLVDITERHVRDAGSYLSKFMSNIRQITKFAVIPDDKAVLDRDRKSVV